MKARRLIPVVLCFLLLWSGGALAAATPPGELPIVTEPVTLTIGTRAMPTVTDYDANALTNLIREKSGVDIQIVPFDNVEYKTQLQLMATAGEKLPDMLWGFSLTDEERESYGLQGYFIPLNDYFAPETGLTHFFDQAQRFLNAQEQSITLSAGLSSDGNLYGFPFWAISVADLWSTGLIINNAFLDALDMEMPETTDDLYNYLLAVRDGDPNGNGKADELPYVGFTGNPYGWTGEVWVPILNAFTFYPDSGAKSFLCVDESGKLYLPFTLDAFREGLTYLHKLYAEGLLSDLSFSQDRYGLQAMTDVAEGEPDIVGLAASHRSYMFANHNTGVKRTHYTSMGPVEGPQGVAYSATMQAEPNYTCFITTDCEHPDVAFRLLDLMTDTFMTLSARYGQQGVHWDWVTEEEKARGTGAADYGYDAADPLYVIRPDMPIVWGQQNDIIWNISAITWQPPMFTALTPKADPAAYADAPIAWYNLNDWGDAITARHGHAPEKLVGTIAYTAEEISLLATSKTDMEAYVRECIVRFILGDMSLETDWTAYLDTLESMGMSQYLSVSQTAYDR